MPVVLLGLGAVAVIVAVAVAVIAPRVSRQVPVPRPLAVRSRSTARTVAAWRAAGIAAGLAAAGWAVHADSLGRGLMLAAPLFALGVLAGVVVGELRVSAPGGPVREAGLTVRRWWTYLPPRLTGVVGGSAAALTAVLVATTLAGSPDDLGRPGRFLVRQCSALMSEARGPWPGSFYAWPLAMVVGGGLLLAGLGLVRIARRPSQGEDTAREDGLRRQSATAVTAAAGLLVTVPLLGVSAFAASALYGITCRPVLWTVLAWGLVVLLPLALVTAAYCLIALLSPAVATRADVPVGR